MKKRKKMVKNEKKNHKDRYTLFANNSEIGAKRRKKKMYRE